jgi:nicotinate phosphoribosyltransferase
MTQPGEAHPASLALLTDLYQLTMAYAYWKDGDADKDASFHLYFRRAPFGGSYAVACGIETAAEFLDRFRFSAGDLAYLESLRDRDDRPLFERAFLDYLARLEFSCDVDAVAEGSVVFPHEPLLRVEGPIIQAQVIESPLLNLINFQTLIATKAARVCQAAAGTAVVEFGLRRAQGIDGALAASRAAHVGGCAATSNVLAGKLYGIPVRGTHAHSWVMSFESEVEAFEAYARALPGNCILLADTYDTCEGVRHAVEVGRRLRQRGFELQGVRLDSGDLARLSIEARRILDEGGFPEAAIVASGDLDEHEIARLRAQGAPITVWGVGTRLVTAYDDPALGGVYKLAAVRRGAGRWEPRMKLSDDPAKSSLPGRIAARRFLAVAGARTTFVADAIYSLDAVPSEAWVLSGATSGSGPSWHAEFPADAPHREILSPLFRGGKRSGGPSSVNESRARAQEELASLPEEVRRLEEPLAYRVGIEAGLEALRGRLAVVSRLRRSGRDGGARSPHSVTPV